MPDVEPKTDVLLQTEDPRRSRRVLGRVQAPSVCAEERRGSLVDLEEEWWNSPEGVLLRDIPFQPYAAITQWLMDDLSRKYA